MMILKNYNTNNCDSNSNNLEVTLPCDDLNTFLNSISKASFCSGVELYSLSLPTIPKSTASFLR